MPQSLANKWVPNRFERDLVRRAASWEACPGMTMFSLTLDAVVRYNVNESEKVGSSNILLISEKEDFDDTEVLGFLSWRTLVRGIPLTEDGCAFLEMAIRPRTEAMRQRYGNVLGTLLVRYENGKLYSVEGVVEKKYLERLRSGKRL